MPRQFKSTPTKAEVSARVRAYLRLDREQSGHPAPRALHRRGGIMRTDRKLREFLRIERGNTV